MGEYFFIQIKSFQRPTNHGYRHSNSTIIPYRRFSRPEVGQEAEIRVLSPVLLLATLRCNISGIAIPQ
jgi:hypothetical protein